MRKLLERYPIAQYVAGMFIRTFIIALGLFVVLFAILQLTGVYAQIESALDLKYSSPFVVVPLWAFLALAVLCLFVGLLIYFHQYKRALVKTTFGSAFTGILEEGNAGEGKA